RRTPGARPGTSPDPRTLDVGTCAIPDRHTTDIQTRTAPDHRTPDTRPGTIPDRHTTGTRTRTTLDPRTTRLHTCAALPGEQGGQQGGVERWGGGRGSGEAWRSEMVQARRGPVPDGDEEGRAAGGQGDAQDVTVRRGEAGLPYPA